MLYNNNLMKVLNRAGQSEGRPLFYLLRIPVAVAESEAEMLADHWAFKEDGGQYVASLLMIINGILKHAVGEVLVAQVDDKTGELKRWYMGKPELDEEGRRPEVIQIKLQEGIEGMTSKDRLCRICIHKGYDPECPSGEISFGDGKGNDNITACVGFERETCGSCIATALGIDAVWEKPADIRCFKRIRPGPALGVVTGPVDKCGRRDEVS